MGELDKLLAAQGTQQPVAGPTPAPQQGTSGGSALDALLSHSQGQQAAPAPGLGAKVGTFLGKVSNALDVPLAYGEAVGHGVTTGDFSHVGQVTSDLKSGGIDKVADYDIYFRRGSLQRVLEDPTTSPQSKRTAQYFLNHPTSAGIADFVTEFAHPSNAIMGAVGRSEE